MIIRYIKNKVKSLLFLPLTAALIASCDNGFESMNTDPNAVVDPNVDNLFSFNQLQLSGTGYENHRANLIYCGAMIQHFASLTTYWSGDKYLYSNPYSAAYFETAYREQGKELARILDLTDEDPELSNKYNIARIWKVVMFHRITDLYGNVPYSEAIQGYEAGIYSPAYDQQSAIYMDMLNELDEAAQALDPAKVSFEAADFIYTGDVNQWRKFAYSLMLRLAMRLTEVDPATAEEYTRRAIAGGVMTSNADLARVPHTDGPLDLNRNLDGRTIETQELDPTNLQGRANSKLSDTFVSFLQDNNDPRLPVFATLWQGNADPSVVETYSAPALQKGLPNGYDANTIQEVIPGWGTTDSLPLYSEPNLNTVASSEAPTFLQTYAEVEFLLAEAALRGWASGTPAEHYNAGVTAAMDHMSLYGEQGIIDPAAITAYLTAHPYNVAGTMEQQMEQIHTQYWATCFLNSYEAYANWRRTGYPVLTPTNYPGNVTGGSIPRRLRYPQSEASVNSTQYNAAVAEQGPDLFTTRMWWDVQ